MLFPFCMLSSRSNTISADLAVSLSIKTWLDVHRTMLLSCVDKNPVPFPDLCRRGEEGRHPQVVIQCSICTIILSWPLHEGWLAKSKVVHFTQSGALVWWLSGSESYTCTHTVGRLHIQEDIAPLSAAQPDQGSAPHTYPFVLISTTDSASLFHMLKGTTSWPRPRPVDWFTVQTSFCSTSGPRRKDGFSGVTSRTRRQEWSTQASATHVTTTPMTTI